MPDLSGLPPALVLTGDVDPLRSEEAYAQRVVEASVPVEVKHYEGGMHEFCSMPAVIATAKQAHQDVAEALRSAFGTQEGYRAAAA